MLTYLPFTLNETRKHNAMNRAESVIFSPQPPPSPTELSARKPCFIYLTFLHRHTHTHEWRNDSPCFHSVLTAIELPQPFHPADLAHIAAITVPKAAELVTGLRRTSFEDG